MNLKISPGKIIFPLVAFLFGSGAFWQYGQYKIAQNNQELEHTKVIMSLRSDINSYYFEAMDKTNELFALNRDFFERQNSKTKLEIDNIRQKIYMLQDNCNELEKKLAVLENRKPRTLNLNFDLIPPAQITDLQ
jgi:hypothetical protein